MRNLLLSLLAAKGLYALLRSADESQGDPPALLKAKYSAAKAESIEHRAPMTSSDAAHCAESGQPRLSHDLPLGFASTFASTPQEPPSEQRAIAEDLPRRCSHWLNSSVSKALKKKSAKTEELTDPDIEEASIRVRASSSNESIRTQDTNQCSLAFEETVAGGDGTVYGPPNCRSAARSNNSIASRGAGERGVAEDAQSGPRIVTSRWKGALQKHLLSVRHATFSWLSPPTPSNTPLLCEADSSSLIFQDTIPKLSYASPQHEEKSANEGEAAKRFRALWPSAFLKRLACWRRVRQQGGSSDRQPAEEDQSKLITNSSFPVAISYELSFMISLHSCTPLSASV